MMPINNLLTHKLVSWLKIVVIKLHIGPLVQSIVQSTVQSRVQVHVVGGCIQSVDWTSGLDYGTFLSKKIDEMQYF